MMKRDQGSCLDSQSHRKPQVEPMCAKSETNIRYHHSSDIQIVSISGGQGAEIIDKKFNGLENREEGKYQESIKSSNTPDWITIWESDKTQ